MGLTFNNGKIRLVVVLSLVMALLVSFSFSPIASASAAEVNSKEEVVTLNGLELQEEEVSATVAPLLVWGAAVLAAAGLSWLAEKLLDYGATKFCKAYRNDNSVTKTVCNVIAP